MKNLNLLGRILYGLPFGIIGLNHFFMTDVFLGMMTSYVPGGAYTVFLAGFFLIAASVLIIINRYVTVACYGLVFMLSLFILTIHIPNLFTSHAEMALFALSKDLALLGASLLIANNYKSVKND
ncbi:MAG: hypothetical protein WHT29_11380 [Bacteroidales bacterium]